VRALRESDLVRAVLGYLALPRIPTWRANSSAMLVRNAPGRRGFVRFRGGLSAKPAGGPAAGGAIAPAALALGDKAANPLLPPRAFGGGLRHWSALYCAALDYPGG
jgi:hypothetical protein